MTATLPTYFDFPLASDGEAIAPTRVIDKRDELGKHPIERVNRLYAACNRPAVWAMRHVTPLEQPSTSYVWSGYAKVKLGADRADWTVTCWGADGDVEVVLYNTSKVQVATTNTITLPTTTPGSASGTWGSVAITEGYIRYKIKAHTSLIGYLYELKALPDVLAAAEIP